MSLTLWSPASWSYPLPPGHRFPVAKYTLLRDRVVAEGLIDATHLHAPESASDDALRRVHDAEYLRGLRDGTLDAGAIRRLGFPWSSALVERAARAVGGTVAAARHALAHGIAANA